MFEGRAWEAGSFNQPLNNWNVSKVEDMECMFANATSFNQPLNNWNVSNVKNICWMFSEASSFNQPLNKWNVVGSYMPHVFDGASSFDQRRHAPWYVPTEEE